MKGLINKIELWAFRRITKDYISFLKNNKPNDVKSSFQLKNNKSYILLAFLIGFSTTIPPVLFEILFNVFTDFNVLTFSIFIISLLLFVAFEFYLLYILGFRLIAKWGVSLYTLENQYLNINQKEFIKSLIRIIMELPEKKVTSRHNLNPYEHNSSQIILLSFLYKIKVFATNFIAKFIVKKMLTRSSFRGYASLIAAPITGLWDAYIFWRVVSISKFKILERIFYMRLLLHNKNLVSNDRFQLLLRLRYYIYGEYNVNLDYILSKTFQERFDYSKEKVLDYLEYINDDDKKILALMLSFKYQLFNSKEKEIIESFDIKEEIFKYKKIINDSELESIDNMFNELLKAL